MKLRLYRELKSPAWWCDLHIHGRRVRRSTHETDRVRARAKAQAIYAQLLSTVPPKPAARGERRDLAALATFDVDAARARRVTEAQLASVELSWAHLNRVLGATTLVETIDYDLLVHYIAHRRSETHSNGQVYRAQSVVKELQALRRGLSGAHRRGWIMAVPALPSVGRRDPPREHQRGHLHDEEIIRRWLDALEPEARRAAIVAVQTGLRREELKRLRASWVCEARDGSETDAILVLPAEATKTRDGRTLGLPDRAANAIREAANAAGGDDVPLFTSDYRKSFDQARALIGYTKRITFRDLRHTFATIAMARTNDPTAVMVALGHHDLRTTTRYVVDDRSHHGRVGCGRRGPH